MSKNSGVGIGAYGVWEGAKEANRQWTSEEEQDILKILNEIAANVSRDTATLGLANKFSGNTAKEVIDTLLPATFDFIREGLGDFDKVSVENYINLFTKRLEQKILNKGAIDILKSF